ncbi:MAG: hypothetical protein HYY21_07950 [Candidatus Tectomicrobia bacterium]|nr:hypothetical protein [Candidatus Tectomicrobia bacterium]
MNAVGHIVSSAVAGLGVGTLTGSPETGTAFFLAGWAIDLDHALDFTRQWGPREALTRMARMGLGEHNRTETVYLFFHGYEISALLWLLAALFPASPWLLGTAMGHLFHLLLDQVTNLKGWRPTYFLFYRALNRFSHDVCFPDRRVAAPLGASSFWRPVPQEAVVESVSEERPRTSPPGP